jgi:hypothetical protein
MGDVTGIVEARRCDVRAAIGMLAGPRRIPLIGYVTLHVVGESVRIESCTF